MRPILALLLLIASACSSVTSDIRVQSRRYADIDVAALRVYEWSPSAAIVLDTTDTLAAGVPDVNALVQAAITRELAAAGLKPVASGAVLRVDFTVIAKRSEATAAQVRLGDAEAAELITEGSALIELHHVPTNALIWRGIARTTSERQYPPEIVKERIDYAIHELFRTLGP